MFNPAAYLINWIFFALAVQFFAWPALLVGFFCLLAAGKTGLARWIKLAYRAKWLLLTLWIVLAYGTPGDLWQGLAWAPSLEGMETATLHVLRLLLLLGSLAWLFEKLPHQRFIVSLWLLIRPFQVLGVNADRTVARLALVFDYLENAPPKGSWRHFIDTPTDGERILETLVLDIPHWRKSDALFLAGVITVLTLLLMLP